MRLCHRSLPIVIMISFILKLKSGNPLDPWAEVMSPEVAFERAQVAANIANCTPPVPEDTSFIADCLRTKSADELLEISIQVSDTTPVAIHLRRLVIKDMRLLQEEERPQ